MNGVAHNLNPIRLGDIVADLGGELFGSADLTIQAIGPLQGASQHTLSFLSNPKYSAQLASSQAACVIVAPASREQALARGATLVTPDPYLYFARLTQWWAKRFRPPAIPGLHPTAVVHPTATLGVGVSVGLELAGKQRSDCRPAGAGSPSKPPGRRA